MANRTRSAVPTFVMTLRLRPEVRAVLVRAVEDGRARDLTDAIAKLVQLGDEVDRAAA